MEKSLHLINSGDHLFSSFNRTEPEKGIPLVYYAFDLLSLERTDLGSRPLIERRAQLTKLLKKAPETIRFSDELQGSREELLQVAQQFQLEGLIAKRPQSTYEAGRRSGAWVKVKLTQRQEFVIGGYTPPERSRKYFGAFVGGLLRSGGSSFRGQSRHRLFRKGVGNAARWDAENQAYLVSFREPAREKTRSMGPGNYAGSF
jgi:ATP-dependent DNA ligase